MTTTHPLPPLYAGWLDAVLGAPIPPETRSTCAACPLLPGPDGTSAAAITYDPRTKCCGYYPDLPNYLVGGVLGSELPARTALRERIAGRVGVSPLGVWMPPAAEAMFRGTGNLQGRSLTMRCPYYVADTGLCGMHTFRNHVCSTWFCRPVRGHRGGELWKAVQHLLAPVETGLSLWAALEVGASPRGIDAVIVPDGRKRARMDDGPAIDGVLTDADHALRWGEHAGREEELFLATWERVRGLSWDDVLAICGPEVHLRQVLLERRFHLATRPVLPDRLVVGMHQVVGVGPQGARVVTWSALDPLDLPASVLGVLHHFDGRTTREAIQGAYRDGVRLDFELLQRLMDADILLPPEGW